MIRVLIADDHAVVRRGLRDILEAEPDLQLVAEAGDAAGTRTLAASRAWDVAVVDLSMPGAVGLDLVRDLCEANPGRALLVLSMHAEEQFAIRALRAGAAGYLTKESAPDLLVEAIRRVAQGKRFVSPSLAERLASDAARAGRPAHERLSDREFQVLRLIAAGKSPGEIAEALGGLSVKTVSTYRARLLEKLGLRHNAELTRYAMNHQLAD